MAKILVTGGAGFIGSHIVDRLIELGNEIVVLDDLSSGKKENVNKKARLIIGDIRGNINELFEKEKFDYVFHLAAQINVRESLKNPKKDAEINILGSLNLIENCVKYKIKKFIFSSTGGAIYSPDAKIPCEENSKVEPLSPYGLAKFTIENYLRIAKDVFGLDYACLRYSNVYGPRQNSNGEAGVVSIFIDSILSGKQLKINGDGKQTRDFVYVRDVADADILAMELNGIYNVSSAKETSVNEIAEKIKDMTNSNINIIHGEAIKGEVTRSCLSNDKIKREGWNPKHDIDKGLKETIDWFKSVKK